MKTMQTVIAVAALCSGCALLHRPSDPRTKRLARVPFVEKWSELHGEWLDEGIHGGMRIDFPTYGFNEEARVLTDYGRPGIDTNAAWILLFGSGASHHGDAGGGAASGLDAICSLPYTTNGVSIISAEGSGTVTVRCWEQSYTLAPGDVVRHQSTWVHTNVFGDRAFRIRLTEKARIENYGLVSREDVKRGRREVQQDNRMAGD